MRNLLKEPFWTLIIFWIMGLLLSIICARVYGSSHAFEDNTALIILKYEGIKYHDDKRDPGGPTKYGWTLRTYRAVVNRFATKNTIKNLTKKKAIKLYKEHFWEKYGASRIHNKNLAIALLLAQINLGPTRPNKLLQQTVNNLCDREISVDGIVGRKSLLEINSCRVVWPGYPYFIHKMYRNDPRITPVWNWAKRGLRKRIFHGVRHH